MKQNWERWEPTLNMSKKYYVDSIVDDINGLKIILVDASTENGKVEMIFDHSVHSYHSTDESYRQKLLYELNSDYGTQFYSEWTLFKVTNSEYVRWIADQSFQIATSEKLFHFVIVAVDSIVDIIAAYEPQIMQYTLSET